MEDNELKAKFELRKKKKEHLLKQLYYDQFIENPPPGFEPKDLHHNSIHRREWNIPFFAKEQRPIGGMSSMELMGLYLSLEEEGFIIIGAGPRGVIVTRKGNLEADRLIAANESNKEKAHADLLGKDLLDDLDQPFPWEGYGPWLNIPDHKWHRRAVYMLWLGYERSEIGEKLGLATQTIYNVTSQLHIKYPDDVPTRSQTKKPNKLLQKWLEKNAPN